ncbi:hypothetical protein MANI_024612 [Metarhizium anisopliae]|nr:hypothetical protein MANI_024612 [Metarhizium anisopliae]
MVRFTAVALVFASSFVAASLGANTPAYAASQSLHQREEAPPASVGENSDENWRELLNTLRDVAADITGLLNQIE